MLLFPLCVLNFIFFQQHLLGNSLTMQQQMMEMTFLSKLADTNSVEWGWCISHSTYVFQNMASCLKIWQYSMQKLFQVDFYFYFTFFFTVTNKWSVKKNTFREKLLVWDHPSVAHIKTWACVIWSQLKKQINKSKHWSSLQQRPYYLMYFNTFTT